MTTASPRTYGILPLVINHEAQDTLVGEIFEHLRVIERPIRRWTVSPNLRYDASASQLEPRGQRAAPAGISAQSADSRRFGRVVTAPRLVVGRRRFRSLRAGSQQANWPRSEAPGMSIERLAADAGPKTAGAREQRPLQEGSLHAAQLSSLSRLPLHLFVTKRMAGGEITALGGEMARACTLGSVLGQALANPKRQGVRRIPRHLQC